MKNESSLRRQSFGMIVVLGIQFLLGTAVNLFVKFPDSGGPGVMWEFANRQPLVMAHMIFGTILLIGAIAFVVMATRRKEQMWKKISWVGLLFILAAWLSGERFVTTQIDAFSFSMAIAFILAILTYLWGIFRANL